MSHDKFAGSAVASNAMRVPASNDPAGWGQFAIWMNYQCPHKWECAEAGTGVDITKEGKAPVNASSGDWLILAHDNSIVVASTTARITP